ncbi:calpain-8-like [Labrus bergylta]|uniref:calpain-8-like n=1 Tax=Labrus bergylta TaxID=56723 RepID=UPI0033134CD6
MTLKVFCTFYSNLDICSLCPDFLDGNQSCYWKSSLHEGRWVAGTTAGGCINNQDSFWTNPQYQVRIDGEYSEKHGDENMLVSLMQKPYKRNRRLVQNLHIGFSVFKVTGHNKLQTGKFPASFFSNNKPVVQSKSYMNASEVMEMMSLEPGEYLIVLSTFKPNETASFILTILSKAETHGYENSGDHKHESVGKLKNVSNVQGDENKKKLFHQHSDKYEEVDAEQLQRLLNDRMTESDLKFGGFSLDACRSMMALMDTSITGKLNGEEFLHLWKKVVTYKDIFFLTDVSRTGTLSLSELRNAFMASGMSVSDDMLNLMAVRYSDSTRHITLESFISLILRWDCMHKIFKELSDGKAMSLQASEWIYISMYT